tara:strand:+ start:279 stop:704 length:426 start_codon:yes stop_codon:yes gene_type:complete
MGRPRCSGDSAINYLTKIRNKTMKADIHKHSATADYKSVKTNITVNKDTGEIGHESLDSMSDDRFLSQVEDCKLIKIWHTEDERADVREHILQMQNNFNFSDDVTEISCSNGSLVTTIYKSARNLINDNAGLSRFGSFVER